MHQAQDSAPDWIDKSFLQKVLRSYKRDETVEVLNFSFKAGFAGHFASEMFRSKIEFKSTKYPKPELETLDVVIKAQPVGNSLAAEIASGGPLFETEARMYRETLPAIHQLFEQSGLKAEVAPELIYATEKPFPIIIVKDLSVDGFFASHQPPEELEDSKLLFQKLAQFHAASFYLAETNQHDFTHYDYCVYKTESAVNAFYLETLLIFKEVLQTWDGYKDFQPKLDHLIENMSAIGRQSYIRNKPGCGYNVLNHGDFHSRNVLLKHNAEKRIEKFYFIDYQLSVYCSPCVDLNYILANVKRDENGELPFAELVMFYHEEFVNALRTFGYMSSPPSLLDLNVELLRHGAFNMMNTICFLPFSFIDWSKFKVEDMVGSLNEDSRSFRKSVYEHPVLKMLLQREMKSWVQKGWL